MTKEKATALSSGLTVASISARGKQVNNTVKAPTLVKTASKNKASGRTDERSDGSKTTEWITMRMRAVISELVISISSD